MGWTSIRRAGEDVEHDFVRAAELCRLLRIVRRKRLMGTRLPWVLAPHLAGNCLVDAEGTRMC